MSKAILQPFWSLPTIEYSIYFAKKGYQVCALELADNNIRAFQKKITKDTPVDLVQGNALDLSRYADESFDVILLFGPLYHLRSAADRAKCIREAKRVCKKDGTLFFSFIGNDMVVLTELVYDINYLKGNTYDHDTFKVEDFPFVFFTVDQCRQMLLDCDLKLLHEIASDGVSELMEELFYRILWFSVKPQHESAIGIHMSPPSWTSLPSPTPSL